jgi:hypothetical protein
MSFWLDLLELPLGDRQGSLIALTTHNTLHNQEVITARLPFRFFFLFNIFSKIFFLFSFEFCLL